MRGQRAVAAGIGRAARRGEDGGGVAPVQEEVEEDAGEGCRRAWVEMDWLVFDARNRAGGLRKAVGGDGRRV